MPPEKRIEIVDLHNPIFGFAIRKFRIDNTRDMLEALTVDIIDRHMFHDEQTLLVTEDLFDDLKKTINEIYYSRDIRERGVLEEKKDSVTILFLGYKYTFAVRQK